MCEAFVNKTHLKTLSRALSSLSKIGADLVIEAARDKFHLRALNSSQRSSNSPCLLS